MVGGFSAEGLPVVVLMDMETEAVFHAQKPERKHQHLFE